MRPRLLILIVVAAGLAVYFASAKSAKLPTVNEDPVEEELSPDEMGDRDVNQKTLDQFPLPGREPAEEPDVSVQVEVDRSQGRNRLYFNISERHGYYVEQFRVLMWWKRGNVKDPEDSPLHMEQFFDQYLKANETLRLCMEVVPAELMKVGEDIGTTADWGAEIAWHGRARKANPDPFPRPTDLGSCD